MSWLSRRVHQSLRALHADMEDTNTEDIGYRVIGLVHHRQKALRRYQQRIYAEMARPDKPLLHKGGKP